MGSTFVYSPFLTFNQNLNSQKKKNVIQLGLFTDDMKIYYHKKAYKPHEVKRHQIGFFICHRFIL